MALIAADVALGDATTGFRTSWITDLARIGVLLMV
jgi:hypothetical protein